MIIETNGSKAQVGGENVINTLHNRHKVTKPLMCNNEYLVKVHQVAGLATKWNEEPHTSFTLTMCDGEKLQEWMRFMTWSGGLYSSFELRFKYSPW